MSQKPHDSPQTVAEEWVTFPGGELEGRRPKALCSSCRDRCKRAAEGHLDLRRASLCFQCYRAGLDRARTLKAAGQIDTASEWRFQSLLPFEPVNKPRLEMLKADRAAARATVQIAAGLSADRRRQAQIAARHALQSIAARLRTPDFRPGERDLAMADAIHAAELQLPESWLPFVVSR